MKFRWIPFHNLRWNDNKTLFWQGIIPEKKEKLLKEYNGAWVLKLDPKVDKNIQIMYIACK